MQKIYEENDNVVCVLTVKDKEKYRKFSDIPRETLHIGENSLYIFNKKAYESFKEFLERKDFKYNIGDDVFVMSYIDKDQEDKGILLHIKPYSNNPLAGYDTLYSYLVTLTGYKNSIVIHRANIKKRSIDKDGNNIYHVKTYVSKMYPDGWIDIDEEDILCKDECVNSDIIFRLNGQFGDVSNPVKRKVLYLVIEKLLNTPEEKNYDDVVNTIESIYEGFLDVIDKEL